MYPRPRVRAKDVDKFLEWAFRIWLNSRTCNVFRESLITVCARRKGHNMTSIRINLDSRHHYESGAGCSFTDCCDPVD